MLCACAKCRCPGLQEGGRGYTLQGGPSDALIAYAASSTKAGIYCLKYMYMCQLYCMLYACLWKFVMFTHMFIHVSSHSKALF